MSIVCPVTDSEVPLILINISMHCIKFKISDMCLALHVVETLRLISKDQINKYSEMHIILINTHFILVTYQSQHL